MMIFLGGNFFDMQDVFDKGSEADSHSYSQMFISLSLFRTKPLYWICKYLEEDVPCK